MQGLQDKTRSEDEGAGDELADEEGIAEEADGEEEEEGEKEGAASDDEGHADDEGGIMHRSSMLLPFPGSCVSVQNSMLSAYGLYPTAVILNLTRVSHKCVLA